MIETNAFGLGGTTKTIPELIQQIISTDVLLEESLTAFENSKERRDEDPSYYDNGGLQHLKKTVEYQNIINNRISKIWIVYNSEVKDFHNEFKKQLEIDLPKATSINPTIATAAFGLGGTKKTVPQLVEQMRLINKLLEQSLIMFLEARKSSDTDRGYYGEGGSMYLKKAVEYQNRMNNRIGKLWIVYKHSVDAYKKVKALPDATRKPPPDPPIPSTTPDATRKPPPDPPIPSTTPDTTTQPILEVGEYYIAEVNFKATTENEIDLVMGNNYYLHENNNPWADVTHETSGQRGYAPLAYLSNIRAIRPLEEGKYYKAIEDFVKKEEAEINLKEGNIYYVTDTSLKDNWVVVTDNSSNENGRVPIDFLSPYPIDMTSADEGASSPSDTAPDGNVFFDAINEKNPMMAALQGNGGKNSLRKAEPKARAANPSNAKASNPILDAINSFGKNSLRKAETNIPPEATPPLGASNPLIDKLNKIRDDLTGGVSDDESEDTVEENDETWKTNSRIKK
jgi:hypothetical protein